MFIHNAIPSYLGQSAADIKDTINRILWEPLGVYVTTFKSCVHSEYANFVDLRCHCHGQENGTRSHHPPGAKPSRKGNTTKVCECPFRVRLERKDEKDPWYISHLNVNHEGHLPVAREARTTTLTPELEAQLASWRDNHNMPTTTMLSLLREAGVMQTSKQVAPL